MKKRVKLAVFGEVLWDIFGEERTIGGAPFNFAAHSARLGADVDFISAVGADENGAAALEAARGFGINTENVAVIDAPTGYCKVTLADGKPTYDLVRGVAFDMIPPPKTAFDADALYFGTLAARGEASRKTLDALLARCFGEVFFDINIRQNYYTDELIDTALSHATILKLSREEMGALSLGGDVREVCRRTAEKYKNLRLVIMTLDRDGALIYDARGEFAGKFYESPVPTSKAVSTVGAGDSFSACFLVNYVSKESVETSLSRAVMLSDYVVTQLGAVPQLPPELYTQIVPT